MYLTHLLTSSATTLLLDAHTPHLEAVKSIPEVVDSLKMWIMGILAAVATLFLVIGGLRYMAAGGDPSQAEQAKGNFKAAIGGYALAVLAPVIMQVLQNVLGG